jgi:hypothetical protein
LACAVAARLRRAIKTNGARTQLCCRAPRLILAGLFAVLVCNGRAWAHAPSFAVYTKYEATVSGQSVAFVFAFDKMPVLALLERDAGSGKIDVGDVDRYGIFFSKYLFDRFSVANAGVPCTHAGELGRFFWDESTHSVLAVTKFVCASELTDLTIRSLVTHDMVPSHELVGDLQYRAVLVRHFFAGDDVEARVVLGSLPASGFIAPRLARHRNRFPYVSVPDEVRRYDALASVELGVDISSSSLPPRQDRDEATLASFIGQGIVHILTGFDHLLFILTLVAVVRSWRQLAVIVTSFTVAHSITLALATLGIVNVSGRVVEPLIALTVLIVAVEAIVRPQTAARAGVAFTFGLIHGLGLSSVLRDLGLTGRAVVQPLLGFNVGVEIGQLLIVGPAFAAVVLMRRNEASFDRVRKVLCTSVAVVAAFWIIVRVRAALAG